MVYTAPLIDLSHTGLRRRSTVLSHAGSGLSRHSESLSTSSGVSRLIFSISAPEIKRVRASRRLRMCEPAIADERSPGRATRVSHTGAAGFPFGKAFAFRFPSCVSTSAFDLFVTSFVVSRARVRRILPLPFVYGSRWRRISNTGTPESKRAKRAERREYSR